MRVIDGGRKDNNPRGKAIFKDVAVAKGHLANDKLGVVYVRANDVYVVTAFGSGVFSKEDWYGK